MELPLVTCIMPTANREKYIPFALDYFLQQNYPNKELVIIDDGIRSVQQLISDDPQIHYIIHNHWKKLVSSVIMQ